LCHDPLHDTRQVRSVLHKSVNISVTHSNHKWQSEPLLQLQRHRAIAVQEVRMHNIDPSTPDVAGYITRYAQDLAPEQHFVDGR
jgi:hypothetical protein